MTREQLLKLRKNPDEFDEVEKVRLRLIDAIEEAVAWKEVNKQLAAGKTQRLVELGVGRYSYELDATSLVNGILSAGEQPVKVIQYDEGEPVRRFEAPTAELTREIGSAANAISFNLKMRGSTVYQIPDGGVLNVRREQVFGPLEIPGLEEQGFIDLDSSELNEMVMEIDAPSEELQRATRRLKDRIIELDNEIESRLQTRYAISVTAILLVMLGMTLAIYLKHSLPLFIYLWAFLPALIDLLVISSGAQLMRDGQVYFGCFVMWIGNVILLAGVCLLTRMISRH